MSDNKWGASPEQARVLTELEEMSGKKIPLVGMLLNIRLGVWVEESNVI